MAATSAATVRDELLGGALHDRRVLAVEHHQHPGVAGGPERRHEAGHRLVERRTPHEHLDGGLPGGGERLQRVGAQGRQHGLLFCGVRADMAANEGVGLFQLDEARGVAHGVYLCKV